MNPNGYKIALTFPIDELKNRVLDSLSVAEISQTEAYKGPHYIGDERQDEFVEANIQLASWNICAALSGWNASTEFESKENINISLSCVFCADDSKKALLSSLISEWICAMVLFRALQAMSASAETIRRAEEGLDLTRQRVLMMLCASDMLRKVS